MRLKRLDLLIAPDDLADFLTQHLDPTEFSGLTIETAAGTLRARVDYHLGLSIPVELTVTVADVRPDRLELAAALRAVLPLPEVGVQKVLERIAASLPPAAVQVQGSHVELDVDQLGNALNVWFRLRRVALTGAGIAVEIEDLVIPPLDQVHGAAASPATPTDVEPTGVGFTTAIPMPAGAEPPLPATLAAEPQSLPPEHRDFYQKLRHRMTDWTVRRVPEKYRPLVPWLLLLPDLFALLCRLMTDGRVSARNKLKLGAVIAYVISPIDLIPDPLPFVGVIDDLGLVLLALASFLEDTPPEVLRDNWSGQADIVTIIQDGSRWVRATLSGGLLRSLRRLLLR